jgi:NTP pyrophosphatase (non-canonical NTP hydrolase)
VQTEQDAADLELGRALRASLDDGLSLFCRDGKWYTSHECEDACGCDGSYDTPTEALSHMWDGTYIMQLGRMLGAEIERSRAQFPGSAHMLAALLEETGEVARALLEGNRPHLREECLHVAATAMRIHEEGDADFTQEARDE